MMKSKACLILALTGLMMITPLARSAIVEVRLDGSILTNATLVDGNDQNNQYITDDSGTLVFEGSCLSLRYTDNSIPLPFDGRVALTILIDSTGSISARKLR